MISADARSLEPELLDGDAYGAGEYQRTLREIALINRFTNGYGPTIAAVARAARMRPGRALRVLDVGFGYGDTLRALRTWSRKSGIELELTGVDLNPRATELAAAATPKEMRIRFVTGNAFDASRLGLEADVIVNALFMHHLDDLQVPRMLRWMNETATTAWFVNDLHRHAIPYHFIKHATRALGFCHMIRNDAPLSVARGFTSGEWRSYLEQAGVDLSRVDIRWHVPFRHGIFGATGASARGGSR